MKLAEALLLRLPINGSFLVRKSDKEADTYVISLLVEGKVYHNRVYVFHKNDSRDYYRFYYFRSCTIRDLGHGLRKQCRLSYTAASQTFSAIIVCG